MCSNLTDSFIKQLGTAMQLIYGNNQMMVLMGNDFRGLTGFFTVMSVRASREGHKIQSEREFASALHTRSEFCDLERIRTSNLQNRNLPFYPVELRSHFILQR